MAIDQLPKSLSMHRVEMWIIISTDRCSKISDESVFFVHRSFQVKRIQKINVVAQMTSFLGVYCFTKAAQRIFKFSEILQH